MEPNVRYARSSGAAIAYQVGGDGPTDLIVVPDYVSNLVYAWESDRWRTFYARLTRYSRLILCRPGRGGTRPRPRRIRCPRRSPRTTG